MSLEQGIVPDAMKLAKVIPIHKAKSKELFINCIPRTNPFDGSTGPFGTLLSGPMCPVTDDMTYWERLEALGAAVMAMVRRLTVNPAPLITMTQGIMRSGVIGMM